MSYNSNVGGSGVGSGEPSHKEYASVGSLPVTGVTGIIYITTDNDKLYRWTGSSYTEVSESIAAPAPQTKYVQTFIISDWTLNIDNDYEITIPEIQHNHGADIIVSVEEINGSFYEQVEVVLENSSGDIKVKINNDLRFDGRVLIN